MGPRTPHFLGEYWVPSGCLGHPLLSRQSCLEYIASYGIRSLNAIIVVCVQSSLWPRVFVSQWCFPDTISVNPLTLDLGVDCRFLDAKRFIHWGPWGEAQVRWCLASCYFLGPTVPQGPLTEPQRPSVTEPCFHLSSRQNSFNLSFNLLVQFNPPPPLIIFLDARSQDRNSSFSLRKLKTNERSGLFYSEISEWQSVWRWPPRICEQEPDIRNFSKIVFNNCFSLETIASYQHPTYPPHI